jgi:hydrogenase/urease accessory protein HupE
VVGVALALLGATALVVVLSKGPGERLPFEEGLLAAALAYERAFALLGLGLALARQPGPRRWLSFLVAAAGIASGIAGEYAFADSKFVAGHLLVLNLPGPLVCVLAGLALALPLSLQSWILPALAAAAGILVGLAIGLSTPAGEAVAFASGAALAGLSIAAIPVLVFPPIRAGWARILTRILGSWLIAIGVMLGGLRVITAKPELPPLAPASRTVTPPASSSLPQAVPPSVAPRPIKRGREDDFGQP